MRIIKILGFAVTCFMCAVSVDAQTTESENDWVVRCNEQNTCQIAYEIKADNVLVTEVLIYKVDSTIVFEYTVPLSISLQKGVVLRVDANPDISTTMLTCEDDGCIGYIKLDDLTVSTFKRGLKLQLIVQSFREKTYYSFDYDLDGFTESFDKFLSISQ